MPDKRLHLLVEADAAARGKRYGALHGKSVSQLVNDFLAALPLGEDSRAEELSPGLRRLRGIAAPREGEPVVGVDDYHRHLEDKYLR